MVLIIFKVISCLFSRLYECQCTYIYVIKCLMKKSPLQLIWGAFFLSVLFFGYLLKISERSKKKKKFILTNLRPLNFATIVKTVVDQHHNSLQLQNIPYWNSSNCSFPIIEIMDALQKSSLSKSSLNITASNDLTNYANDVWLMIVTMTTGCDFPPIFLKKYSWIWRLCPKNN